jgi:hypothetical protein
VVAVIASPVTLVMLAIYCVALKQLIHHTVYRFTLALAAVQDHPGVAHQEAAVALIVLVTTEAVEVMLAQYLGLVQAAEAEPLL